MQLHELQRNFKRPKRKRKARGMGSGNGKTAGRGHRGQGQRSGPHAKPGFEGGQMPLYKRIPKKKHFIMPNKSDWAIINVGRLNLLFGADETVDFQALADKGVIDGRCDGLRILAQGEIKVALNIKAQHVSASAREKIEAAGGSVDIV